MRVNASPIVLLVILAAILCGYWAGQGTGASTVDRQASYESGLEAGYCKPLVYEDGSYVLEDGTGHLCTKP